MPRSASRLSRSKPLAVLAFGGNAMSPKNESGTIAEQFAHARELGASVGDLLAAGWRLCVTHGNGPQVGNRLLQVEAAVGLTPTIPLGVLVADTQGGMGYMLEQCLHNVLSRRGMNVPIGTVITQVVCDRDDPQLENPTKPVGPFYTARQAQRLKRVEGWRMVEDAGRGWRRVVPSPMPRRIVDTPEIRILLDHGYVVVAAGGGGIPVFEEPDGWLEGIDGVVDKDRASAVLAHELGAELLVIATDVEQAWTDFGTPEARPIGTVDADTLAALHARGHFPPGSMGPKVEAALHFVRHAQTLHARAVITSVERAAAAVLGKGPATVVVRGPLRAA